MLCICWGLLGWSGILELGVVLLCFLIVLQVDLEL